MLSLLAWGALASAAEPGASETDAYLQGALTVWLEQVLQWDADEYRLEVDSGIGTITVFGDVAARRAQVESAPLDLPGLAELTVIEGAPEEVPSAREKAIYSFLGIRPETVPFPVGDLFLPLLADPKQPQFFVSYRLYDTPAAKAHVGAVGYGETFGFHRHRGKRPGDGVQLGIAGGLFAQFNLDAPSNELVNADYTIGLVATYRNGATSARLRIYHQSSHLGDEYLLSAQPERVNLSFESVELLGSYQWDVWRGYFGGEYLVHRDPSDLEPAAAHGGFEFRGRRPLVGGGHLVGGADLKSWQEHNWTVDSSLKIGLEFGARQPGNRRLRIMGEVYRGYAPHGQFYRDRIRYYGAGVYLGF